MWAIVAKIGPDKRPQKTNVSDSEEEARRFVSTLQNKHADAFCAEVVKPDENSGEKHFAHGGPLWICDFEAKTVVFDMEGLVIQQAADAFNALRRERDQRLVKTDWHVMRGSMPPEMESYRQQLRDLPSQYTNSSIINDKYLPVEITWPTEPE